MKKVQIMMNKTSAPLKKPNIFKRFEYLIESTSFWSNFAVVVIAFFYLINIKDGHDWGGDFSMYIMNAKNIVDGTPYAQTGYIYNIDTAFYGPPAYPPIFPLILAPFISVWGINLQILKIPGILCFIGCLFLLNNRIIPKEKKLIQRLLYLISIGFFPFFFIQSETILSDFPFLLFCYFSLLFIDEQFDPSIERQNNSYKSFLTGLLIYLACGTRSIGLVLFPVAIILGFLRCRKKSRSLIVILSVPLVLLLIQNLLIPQTGAYFDQIQKTPSNLFSSLLDSTGYYFSLFVSLFQFADLTTTAIVFSFMVEAFFLGLFANLRKRISSFELFFFLYFGLLLIWPSYQGLRFLIPIIPIYFLNVFEGFEKIASLIKTSWFKKIVPISLLICTISYYSTIYWSFFPRPISDIEKNETQELFKYIQTNTNSEDIILFFKPRVLALFTQRKSCAITIPSPAGNTMTRMKELNVSIVILKKNYGLLFQPELFQLISSNPNNFILLYENADFQVFRINYRSAINISKGQVISTVFPIRMFVSKESFEYVNSNQPI